MSDWFDMIERRFRGDRALLRSCRALYEGDDGQDFRSVRTYCEITCSGIDHDNDSFGSDEPRYVLDLSIKSTDRNGLQKCSTIMDHWVRVFDDATMTSGAFDRADMRLLSASGPRRTAEGTYEATMQWELLATKAAKTPATRGT